MMKLIGSRLFEMLKNDEMTDVTFIVQGTEIKAHRNVVSSLGGPLKELLKTKRKRADIEEISPQTFKTVLEYLYTDDCVVDTKNVFDLLHAAKKFNLPHLELHCTKSDVFKLSETNLGALTQQALNFDAREYLELCKKYFKENATKVFNTKEFLETSNEVLYEFCSIEERDCTEMDIFAACIKWAESKCKFRNLKGTPEELRNVLGHVLAKIKFSDMPMEDFLEFVAPLEILTHEEVGRLIVGWQKNKKYEHWMEVVQVAIGVNLSLPLYTRISELKKMKIFHNGELSCPPDKFTLGCYCEEKCMHKSGYKLLSDNVTLASVYTGKDLDFYVNSITCTVKESTGRWEFPVTFTDRQLYDGEEEDVIKYCLKDYQYLHEREAEIEHPKDNFRLPGSIYVVTIKPEN